MKRPMLARIFDARRGSQGPKPVGLPLAAPLSSSSSSLKQQQQRAVEWERHTDPATGFAFFYAPETGETRWALPTAAAAPSLLPPPAAASLPLVQNVGGRWALDAEDAAVRVGERMEAAAAAGSPRISPRRSSVGASPMPAGVLGLAEECWAAPAAATATAALCCCFCAAAPGLLAEHWLVDPTASQQQQQQWWVLAGVSPLAAGDASVRRSRRLERERGAPSLRASLWAADGTTRITDDLAFHAYSPHHYHRRRSSSSTAAAEQAEWGVFGPLSAPQVPGKAVLRVVYWDGSHPLSVAAVNIDMRLRDGVAAAADASEPVPAAIASSKQQSQSQPQLQPPPCFAIRAQNAVLRMLGDPVAATAVLEVNGMPATISLQLALLDRQPTRKAFPAFPVSKPLALTAVDFLPLRRNDVYVSADVATFLRNARSVEGMAVPPEFVIKASVVASCTRVAGPVTIAHAVHVSSLADMGPFARVRLSLPADAIEDRSLYVLLDFQTSGLRMLIPGESSAASTSSSGHSCSESSHGGASAHAPQRAPSGEATKKLSFAWAYVKMYPHPDDPIHRGGTSMLQVYAGPPHRTIDKRTGKFIPIVPAMTAPEDIKPDPKYLKRASALPDPSLAGLAVTSIPVALVVLSATKAAAAKPAMQLREEASSALAAGNARAMEAIASQASAASLVTLLPPLVRQLVESPKKDLQSRCNALMPLFARWSELPELVTSLQLQRFFFEELLPLIPAELLHGYLETAFQTMSRIEAGSDEWIRCCRASCLLLRFSLHMAVCPANSSDAPPATGRQSRGKISPEGMSPIVSSSPLAASPLAQTSSSSSAVSVEVTPTMLEVICGRGAPPPKKALQTVLWAIGHLFPFVLFAVTPATFLVRVGPVLKAAREDAAFNGRLASTIAAFFGEEERGVLEKERREARALLLPLCIECVSKFLHKDIRALELSGTALLLHAQSVVSAKKPDQDLASLMPVAAGVAMRCPLDHAATALGLLNYFSLLVHFPTSLRLGIVNEIQTVEETGALVARLSFAWLTLLDHMLHVSDTVSASKLVETIADSIVSVLALFVDNFFKHQGDTWSYVSEIPHGAVLSLLAAVVDPNNGKFIALSRERISFALSICKEICLSMDSSLARLDPVAAAAAAPAFLRIVAAAGETHFEEPDCRNAFASLCTIIASEWRATKALDGLVIAGTTWLSPLVFCERQALPTATAECLAVPKALSREIIAHAKRLKIRPHNIGRAVEIFNNHVEHVCSAVTAAAACVQVSPNDEWQTVLSLFLRNGADHSGQLLLSAASLHAAERCAEAAAASGDFDAEARLFQLIYDLAWETAAEQGPGTSATLSQVVRSYLDVPSHSEGRHALYRALEALLRAGDFESAVALAKRMRQDGLFTTSRWRDVITFLTRMLLFSLPAAHYLLRFDGYMLPPAVDGGVYICRLQPHQTLHQMISRLRSRFGRDLEVFLGTGERSPVFQPAKSVSITPAWQQLEVDRWAGRVRTIKPERCPAIVSHKPTSSLFSAFFPSHQAEQQLVAPPQQIKSPPSTPSATRSTVSPSSPPPPPQPLSSPVPPPEHASSFASPAAAASPSRGTASSVSASSPALLVRSPIAPSTPMSRTLELTPSVTQRSLAPSDMQQQQQQQQQQGQQHDQQREYVLGDKTGFVPPELERSPMLPPSHPPVLRLNFETEHELPGPLWLARVKAWSFGDSGYAASCTGWVSMQCTKLLYLCSRLRSVTRRDTTASSITPPPLPVSPLHMADSQPQQQQQQQQQQQSVAVRCPACAERLSKGETIAAIEALLPEVLISQPLPPRAAPTSPRDYDGSSSDEGQDEDQAYRPPVFLSGVQQANGLEKPEYAAEVLHCALLEVLCDADADHLLGTRRCTELVARENARRRLLEDALETTLRREYIREVKMRETNKLRPPPKPDFTTLRVKSQESYERLREWLAQLQRIIGYALVQHDRLSRHTPEDLAEHLRLEEVFTRIFETFVSAWFDEKRGNSQ